MEHRFCVDGISFEVRAHISDDGSFRAELFETAPKQRRLTWGAGFISGDVWPDMTEDQQREASSAIIKAIQQAVAQSFEH